MALVKPTRSRLQVRRAPGRVVFVTPAPRRWLVVPFLTVWLCGWGFGEVMAIRLLLQGGTPDAGKGFLLVWLALWTVGGALAMGAVLWSAAGREEIAVGERTLAIRHAAGPIGRTRQFDLSAITNLRAESAAAAMSRYWGGAPVPSTRLGRIAFDYGARTYRLGVSLDGQDVETVLEAIRERLPSAASSRRW